MAVSAFGTQFTYPGQFSPWSGAQQGIQGLGINPYAFQQYTQNQPLMSAPLTSTIAGPSLGAQQVLPLLQVVPQQLQHLQQLVSVQLQELQQLQQIVQLLPGQLQQIQQLIQYVPQQLQQLVAAPTADWSECGSRHFCGDAAVGIQSSGLRRSTRPRDVTTDGNVVLHDLRTRDTPRIVQPELGKKGDVTWQNRCLGLFPRFGPRYLLRGSRGSRHQCREPGRLVSQNQPPVHFQENRTHSLVRSRQPEPCPGSELRCRCSALRTSRLVSRRRRWSRPLRSGVGSRPDPRAIRKSRISSTTRSSSCLDPTRWKCGATADGRR